MRTQPCTEYSTWLLDRPASPLSRFYSFVGQTDGQFGDIQWTLDHFGGDGFLGNPVNISTSDPGDSHRFYANDGHGTFDGSEYWPALQAAWDVPQENMDYAEAL